MADVDRHSESWPRLGVVWSVSQGRTFLPRDGGSACAVREPSRPAVIHPFRRSRVAWFAAWGSHSSPPPAAPSTSSPFPTQCNNNNNNNNNTGRSPSTATCHPATCSSLWLSRLLAHWLVMDTRSFGRLAGGLHYALLIHGKPIFSTNASRLRFSDLTQYAWPTHFQFPSPQVTIQDISPICLIFMRLGMKYQWAKKIIIVVINPLLT